MQRYMKGISHNISSPAMKPTETTSPPWQPPTSKALQGAIKQSLVINWVKRTMSFFIFEQSGKDYLCTPAAGFNWVLVIPANNKILIKYMESVRCSFEKCRHSFSSMSSMSKRWRTGKRIISLWTWTQGNILQYLFRIAPKCVFISPLNELL